MSWYDGPLVLVDTETTGVDVENDRIVTACAVLIPPRSPKGGARQPKVFSWLADPGVEIPQGATDVHGISTEYAREHGRPAAEVVEQFVSMLDTLTQQGAPLVLMNAQFDLTIADRECERHGLKSLDQRMPWGVRPVVDVFVIDKGLPDEKYRKGSRNLTALCDYYGVKIEGAHDSTADALAAGRVAWAICKRYPEVAAMKLDDLHDAQVRWKAEQARSFAAYLRGQGKPADDVRPEWPFIPKGGPRGVSMREAEAMLVAFRDAGILCVGESGVLLLPHGVSFPRTA